MIIECAAGHEGLHGVLIDADGAAHFVGVARRGEDGDPCKLRTWLFFEVVVSPFNSSQTEEAPEALSSETRRRNGWEVRPSCRMQQW